MSETTTKRMEDIVALCRRRGFIFQSSEIYGGINGFWDYGPNGVELKRNLKDAWWDDIVHGDATGPTGANVKVVGVDCTIIMNPRPGSPRATSAASTIRWSTARSRSPATGPTTSSASV